MRFSATGNPPAQKRHKESSMDDVHYRTLRERMVTEQLAGHNVTDRRVLDAMLRVPRHRFVPPDQAAYAYDNRPLPLLHDQTISQPLMVAIMLQAAKLKGDERVIEVGTGSGYQAALLAELAGKVTSIERLPDLAHGARNTLQALGYLSVEIVTADGSLGYPPSAPYDRILVAAGAPRIPEPLLEQLAPGGLLIVPVGDAHEQTLLIVFKDASQAAKLAGAPLSRLWARRGGRKPVSYSGQRRASSSGKWIRRVAAENGKRMAVNVTAKRWRTSAA
jgi:protein-L-isoaspartate(D-aspartate) O-methyltransferase